MRLVRRLLPYTSIAAVLALAFAGWTLLSRWRARRAGVQAAEAAQAGADRKIGKAYGDGRLKILAFYASPPTLQRGEKGLLCYSVANATAVRIEPGFDAVTPSLSRCLEVTQAKSTEYTLTARDAAGGSGSQTVVLKVR